MNYLKTIAFVSFTLVCASSVGAQTSATAEETHPTALPDSIINKIANYEKQVQTLTTEKAELKKLYKESLDEAEASKKEVANLQAEIQSIKTSEIKKLETKNDSLQRKLISMASNFMYIPYEEYSIDKIAIPAFQSIKGTPLYDKYKVRLEILENYRSDIQVIADFLTKAAKGQQIKFDPSRKKNGEESLAELKALPTVARYKSYNDWQNTYLGKKIDSITSILTTHGEDASTKLQSIQTEISTLIKN